MKIRYVTELFDYKDHLGVSGIISSPDYVRSGVWIGRWSGMDMKTRKKKMLAAKKQVREQLRLNIGCVHGEKMLEGNEVELAA